MHLLRLQVGGDASLSSPVLLSMLNIQKVDGVQQRQHACNHDYVMCAGLAESHVKQLQMDIAAHVTH